MRESRKRIPARMAGYLPQRQRLLLGEILAKWSMPEPRHYSITTATVTNAGPTSTPSLSVARAGEDIGNVAVWLCSEADRFVTGQSILVDGGFNIADAR